MVKCGFCKNDIEPGQLLFISGNECMDCYHLNKLKNEINCSDCIDSQEFKINKAICIIVHPKENNKRQKYEMLCKDHARTIFQLYTYIHSSPARIYLDNKWTYYDQTINTQINQ